MIERYRALSSCQISDALAELGLPHRGLEGAVTLDLSAKIVGPAFTVTCLPAEESVGRRIEYLGDIPAGAVVMLANGGRLDCSVWGGQRTLAARQRGAVAAVVDGAYRDIPEHASMGFPVFARGRTVVGSAGVANPVASQETVTMGGLSVSPGDLVLGDASGVVIVPAAEVERVLETAEVGAAEEQRVVAEVTAGRDFFDARGR
jgi:4-hydroxy-4-methyl-2-oxoglutarate aldolase